MRARGRVFKRVCGFIRSFVRCAFVCCFSSSTLTVEQTHADTHVACAGSPFLSSLTRRHRNRAASNHRWPSQWHNDPRQQRILSVHSTCVTNPCAVLRYAWITKTRQSNSPASTLSQFL